jgi:hypothetical protein
MNGLTLGNNVTVDMGSSAWYFNGAENASGTIHHLATLGTSTLNTAGGQIYISASNEQTLQIDSGITVQGYGSLSQSGGASSTIINAGTITTNTADQTFTVSSSAFNNTGTINVLGGTMESPSALVQSGTLNIASGATFKKTLGFTNTGSITGAGTIFVGTGTSKLTNQGSINPGGSLISGTLNITGDLYLSTGSNLVIDLGGTSAGQSDKIIVTGAVTMAGALNTNLLSGYTAQLLRMPSPS